MIRIMICDDDPCFATALSEKLTALASKYDDELDFKIGPIFTNGELVLSFMDTMSFDIIFIDIDMPKMSGFELAQEITKRNPTAAQEGTFMTALSTTVTHSLQGKKHWGEF